MCVYHHVFSDKCTMFSVINQERTLQNIEHFDKANLKHAETAEKNQLPSKDSALFKLIECVILCCFKEVHACQLYGIVNMSG